MAIDLQFAVVPVLTGPLTALLAMLPWLLVALGGLLLSLLKPSMAVKGLKLLWREKLSVAVVGGGGIGVVWAALALWPEPSPATAPEAEAGSDWPLFRGNLARTGVAPGTPEPTRARLNWVFRGGGAGFLSSPTVVGNRVYLSTAVTAIIGGDSGEICCLDADTGGLVWHAAPPGYRATFSSPVVSGNYLVCGEGLHFTRDARVVCLDLRPGSEGKVLWTHPTSSHVECTPIIDDGRVYVGAGDDGYYCLKLEGDGNGQAQVLWHVPTDKHPDAETSLAVYDGRVYAGLGLGGQAICVLDAKTGEELRRIPTDYPVFGPAAVAGGKLYVGMGNGDMVHSAEELKKEPLGEVWCVDLATLEVDWKCRVGQTVLGAIATAGNRLYFGSRDGVLYCIGKDGKRIATFNAHEPILASPAVTEHYVYFSTDSGMLYCLSRETLDPVWEFKAGSKALVISSPAIARGHVYLGTQYDGFLSIGEPGDVRQVPLWPGRLGGPGAGGNLDGTPLPEEGALHWQYPADQEGATVDTVVAAPVAAVGDHLLVPLAGRGERCGLVCLPLKAKGGDCPNFRVNENGTVPLDARQTPKPRWFYKTPNGVSFSPAVSGDTALVVDGRPGDAGRHLHALELATGRKRWQLPVADDASGVLLCTADEMYVQDAPGSLARVSLLGVRVWQQLVGKLDHSAAVSDAMLLAAVSEPPSLVAMDRPTGRPLWRVKLDAPPTTAPVVDKDTVFLGTSARLEVRSLADGKPRDGFRGEEGGVSSDLVVSQQIVAYVSDQGQLVVISRRDPTAVRKLPGAMRGIAPLLSRGILLYAGKDALMWFEPDDDDAQPSPWVDISRLGRPAAPMVLADGSVYLGVTGRGLVRFGAGLAAGVRAGP